MHNLEVLKNKLITYPQGSDNGYTLIGPDGLNNIADLLTKVYNKGIDGDFVETGVWKGGACIYARAVMNHLGMTGKVYACDSYKGLPKPNVEKYPYDLGDIHFKDEVLRVSKETVKGYFSNFGLDHDVEYVEGWFSDTIPKLKNELKEIAVLRLDGDMYESTIVVLNELYDLVPVGGYIIIDDYCLVGCAKAVEDFRHEKNISSPLNRINNCIVYWEKQ